LSLGKKLSRGDKIVPFVPDLSLCPRFVPNCLFVPGDKETVPVGQFCPQRQLYCPRGDNFLSMVENITVYISRFSALEIVPSCGDKIVPIVPFVPDLSPNCLFVPDLSPRLSLCPRGQRDSPRGTILSPRDNFVPRDKMTFGDILAITLPFFDKYDQRLKNYSRDLMPSDPG
jgi:hypothetical protein